MCCSRCGRQFEGDFCPYCGERVRRCRARPRKSSDSVNEQYSDRNWLITLILCVVVGKLGVHRFYCGKIGTGILWLLTGGCFLVGYILDIIAVAQGKFRDIDGKIIKREIKGDF